MKHAFAIILFLLSCTALGAEPMTATIDRYVRTLGVDASLSITDAKNQMYSDKVADKSGIDTGSWLMFGKLGGDTFNFRGKALVGSPIEYYYTDLVFMKKEYGKALMGLYRNLAEMPGKRSEVNEAIGLVKEVARRRGERCDERAARARYAREIRAEIEATWSKSYGTEKIRERDNLLNYYLNPTTANLNKIVSTAKGFADSTQFDLYMDTIKSISLDFREYLSTRL